MPSSVAAVQRRTLRLLFVTQIVGAVGVAIGISVGGLLTAKIAGTRLSGLAQSAAVVGGALLALPVTRVTDRHGRRRGLVIAYATGAVGALLVVVGASADQLVLLFAGLLLFGGGTTANLQARYAATDLAPPERRGRHLSLIVWATTLGAVAAPLLAPLADRFTAGWGLAELTGPFVVSAVAFTVGGLALGALLRPDPLRTARAHAGSAGTPAPGRATGVRAALPVLAGNRPARLAVAAVAVGHLVMVGVMSMTPVHLGHHHPPDRVLGVVGIVLSAHIAGMYALAPLVGMLTDRYGARVVIGVAVAVLAAACVTAAGAGADTTWLTVGLTLLGVGWSGTMVAGSTLLSAAVPLAARPAAQGLSDLLMGLAGAAAGAVSGFVVAAHGYRALGYAAALAAVPLAYWTFRPGREHDMRLTDFWQRLEAVFGPGYARSVAADQVLPHLDGRTIDQALAAGVPTVAVWRAVCAAYPDRVPARLR